MNENTRCLAHGCEKRDDCLRHVAIRQRNLPDDGNVVDNACAISHHSPVPLPEVKDCQSAGKLAAPPWQSLDEGDVRRAAWAGE